MARGIAGSVARGSVATAGDGGDASIASGGLSLDPADGLGSIAPDFGGTASGGDGGGDGGTGGGAKPKRKYTRRGAGSGKSKPNSNSVETLSRILAIVHTGLAAASKTPELELSDKESEALGSATANVLAQFDIAPDPRVEAIVGLVTVAGMIYGPRMYLIRERKSEEKKQREQERSQYP